MSESEKDFLNKARPLAEKLLDYAMTAGKPFGITDARVSISSSEKQNSAVEKSEVVQAVSGATNSVSVTIYAGDRVLSFSKNTLDESELCAAMLKNMEVIHIIPENKGKRLLEADKVYKGARADLNIYEQNQPDQKTLIAYAKEVEAAAMDQPGVKTIRAVSISKSKDHYLAIATNGLDQHESTTLYQASAEVVAEDKIGMQIDGDYSIARYFSYMSSPGEVGKNAGKNAVAKLGAILPATSSMPVVLDHAAAEDFFSQVYSAIGGGAVYRGTTFMKDKIGQQVMSKGVTIVDDPGIAKGISSSTVDSAGLETKKITFIEDGVLKSFNVNLMESRQLGIEPIGREDGTTNSRVLPGTLTPDELISDIKEGIYIKGFNGGTVNVNNGIHSRSAYGRLIKDGKITDQAVDGFAVSGNLKEMFMNVALANDTPELPDTRYTLAAPTTRINGVTISGKK